MLVAFFDMFRLPLLLAGVRGFIATGHVASSKGEKDGEFCSIV
jgi:hypothetical protein